MMNQRNNLSTPRNINFDYSENFNRIIELSILPKIIQVGRVNTLYLLTMNNLENYVITEKIKKLKKRNIKDDFNEYIDDK